jgi:Xaa-Pro aminopeptidase
MPSPTTVATRIDRSLHAMLAEVRALAGTAEEWDTLSDAERAAIALDWDHLLADYLTELDRFFQAGEMTAEQQQHYQALLQQLREALPIFDRLGLLPLPSMLTT